MTQRVRCPHGKEKPYCRDCGGSQVCEHSLNRAQCRKCGGRGICEHGKVRNRCKDCGGASICEHGVIREQCIRCGGNQFCRHSRKRSQCSRCRPEGTYKKYKTRALKMGIPFELSLEDFIGIVSGSCVYCGESVTPMACDKIDNTKGYVISNCQSACDLCNSMKSDRLEKEFEQQIRRIAQYRLKMETV